MNQENEEVEFTSSISGLADSDTLDEKYTTPLQANYMDNHPLTLVPSEEATKLDLELTKLGIDGHTPALLTLEKCTCDWICDKEPDATDAERSQIIDVQVV